LYICIKILYKKGGASLAVGEENDEKTNILILGRQVHQQIGKATDAFDNDNFEQDDNANMQIFLIKLSSMGIVLKQNIDIYFCDIEVGEIDPIQKTIFNKNVRFISKQVDINNLQTMREKIPLEGQIDVIVNDLSTMKFFDYDNLVNLIKQYLKIGGMAFLQDFVRPLLYDEKDYDFYHKQSFFTFSKTFENIVKKYSQLKISELECNGKDWILGNPKKSSKYSGEYKQILPKTEELPSSVTVDYDGPRVRRFGFTYLKVCFKIEKIETEDKKVSAT
jgi:hypothetical protein